MKSNVFNGLNASTEYDSDEESSKKGIQFKREWNTVQTLQYQVLGVIILLEIPITIILSIDMVNSLISGSDYTRIFLFF